MLGWHFVRDDRRLGHDATNVTVAPGYSYYYEGKTPKLCVRGLHGSEFALDALRYANGDIISRIRLMRVTERDDDQAVAWQRDVLAVADARQELRLFACWSVRQAWHLLEDKRFHRVVKVAEQYALGHASAKELAAARSAAKDVEWHGWNAAKGVAKDVAWEAALDAARYAALYTASNDARNAAKGAARNIAAAIAWAKWNAKWNTGFHYTLWAAEWNVALDAQRVELERRMLILVGEDND